MNLAIDIGNTNVKFGLFDKNGLREAFVKDTSFLKSILLKYEIKNAIVSRSGSNRSFLAIQKRLKASRINTVVLTYKIKLPIKNLYKTPESLGADRIAGSVAANFLFPNTNVLKIDFGTCITYDFVNNRKEYLGGAISPGVFMRFVAMSDYTESLPLVFPGNIRSFELIGNDTYQSLASGGINGVIEEVSGIIKQYQKRFDNLKVVVTGGNADTFATLLKCEIFARPNLVLEGMNRILNYNL